MLRSSSLGQTTPQPGWFLGVSSSSWSYPKLAGCGTFHGKSYEQTPILGNLHIIPKKGSRKRLTSFGHSWSYTIGCPTVPFFFNVQRTREARFGMYAGDEGSQQSTKSCLHRVDLMEVSTSGTKHGSLPLKQWSEGIFRSEYIVFVSSLSHSLVMFFSGSSSIPGWWARATPLKNMSSSIGMMKFPIYGKIKFMFQTTNQIRFGDPTQRVPFWQTGTQVATRFFHPDLHVVWVSIPPPYSDVSRPLSKKKNDGGTSPSTSWSESGTLLSLLLGFFLLRQHQWKKNPLKV